MLQLMQRVPEPREGELQAVARQHVGGGLSMVPQLTALAPGADAPGSSLAPRTPGRRHALGSRDEPLRCSRPNGREAAAATWP